MSRGRRHVWSRKRSKNTSTVGTKLEAGTYNYEPTSDNQEIQSLLKKIQFKEKCDQAEEEKAEKQEPKE